MHFKCMIFCVVFIVCDVSGTTSVGSFDRRNCSTNSKEWTDRSDEKNCPTGTQYHCLFNQNGVTGEVCVKESWVQPGYCPLFDTKSQRINVKRCSPFDSLYCPLDPFLSNDVRKHKICLTRPSTTTVRTTSTTQATTEAVTKKNDTGGGGSAAVIVVVIILVLVIVVVVLFLLIRRRNGLFPGTQWKVPFWDIVESVIGKNDQRNTNSEQKENEAEKGLLNQENQLNDITESLPTKPSPPPQITRSNPKFVKTSLCEDLLQKVQENDVVIVHGEVGSGKTAACVGVTEYFRDRFNWNIVDLSVSNKNVTSQNAGNELVFIDSLFGKIVSVVNYRDHVTKALHEIYQFNLEHTDRKIKLLVTLEEGICQLTKEVTAEGEVYHLTKEITAQYPILDKAKIVLVTEEDYTERDLEKLCKMYEMEVNTSNSKGEKSEPILSRFCLPNDCHSRMTTEDSVQDTIVDLLCNMANPKEKWEKEKYYILVSMLLKRFTLDGTETLPLSTLRPEEIKTQMAEMEKSGILTKRDHMFTFANDIILFALVESVRKSDLDICKMTKMCDCYCILQFFRPKTEHITDGNAFRGRCFMSPPDDLEAYDKMLKRFHQIGNVEAIENHELYQKFKETVVEHENVMSTKHKRKLKGSDVVRKMIQYHPYLTDFYAKTQDIANIMKGTKLKTEKFQCCTKREQ